MNEKPKKVFKQEIVFQKKESGMLFGVGEVCHSVLLTIYKTILEETVDRARMLTTSGWHEILGIRRHIIKKLEAELRELSSPINPP